MTGKITALLLIAATALQPATAQDKLAWGDQGNGTYINPVLNADYSDPDVIRVGDKYYMTASDFHYMGMQVLESCDMVNWRIVSQLYDHLDYEGWNENRHFGGCHEQPFVGCAEEYVEHSFVPTNGGSP